jgi:hypothetical protein
MNIFNFFLVNGVCFHGGSKVIALVANLAQGECIRFIFLKGNVFKQEVLCLLDTGASHNFIIRESAERMELALEELKAPIEVHFANGVPHPITLQAKDVPLQLGNWKGKVDLLVFHLRRGGLHFRNVIHHPKQCVHRRA